MKDLIHSTIRKVTLELIYEAVDDRTREIKDRLGRLEDDMRDLRGEINRRFEAVDQKFAALNARLDALHGEMNNRSGEINARFDQLFALIVNQRKESK